MINQNYTVMKKIFVLLSMFLSLESMAQSPGNNVTATDALGRKLPTHQEVGDLKTDKFVGLFYWTWHTKNSRNNPPLMKSGLIGPVTIQKESFKEKQN